MYLNEIYFYYFRLKIDKYSEKRTRRVIKNAYHQMIRHKRTMNTNCGESDYYYCIKLYLKLNEITQY